MSKKLFFLISFALVLSLVGANVVFGEVWEGRIASGQDDWEQLDGGAMRSATSSDIEMPYEDTGQGDKQISGLRFIDVGIPAGANITAAYLEFVVDETKGGNEHVSLLLEAEKTANAAPLSNSNDVAGRARTDAKVVWVPKDWTQADQVSQSSDISSIIQELLQKRNGQPTPADGGIHEDTWVSLSWKQGWESGNSILMIVSDDPDNPSVGIRCAESFNGDSGDAALLHIEYTAGQASVVTHDVYLGDNFDEVNEGTGDTFRGNQTVTDYVVGFPGFPYPDGLVPGDTYYWRVDMVEADGTAHKGDVWSFSIPPQTAYSPDPVDGTEFVDLDATLGWTGGFNAKLHTVYIGTDFDDVNNAAGGAPMGFTSYDPGPLESEKVYYWRVDEFDPPFTHTGDVWSFTTPGAVGNSQ
ncbi:MAG: hypothetical protein U9Q07_04980, partial [Planctomycetota bacterium]|nr:hypothetical protein [Planctomycetota bacterium]